MYYKLSIIFGFKNRDTVRVRRCLDSLQQQSLKEFHVCFVDYGSEDNVSGEIQALVQRYSFCKYVHVPSQGQFWNRGHALNIGVRQSKPSEYILTTDIDLVFPPNFIENLIGYLRPDRLLSWTVPVYMGATNIDQFFPEGSFIQVDPDVDSLKEVLTDLDQDNYQGRLLAIAKAREMILDKYQLFPFLSERVLNSKLENSPYRTYQLKGNRAPWEGGTLSLSRKIQYQWRKLINKKPY